MTKIRVYQANQIGGCVTVITAKYRGETHRIMVDYGSSLAGNGCEEDFSYPWKEEPVDAVFFTHYHGDHVGRLMEIPDNVPLYMGPVAREAMINIYESLAQSSMPDASGHQKEVAVLKNDERVRTFHWNGSTYDTVSEIPLFSVEPYSIDHSAYDAYMFLIETKDEEKGNGTYVTLHTGDFRGHGRRGHKMLPLIEGRVRRFGRRKVDALVIEGTMLSRAKEKVMSEPQMQIRAARYLRDHKYAFLICSSTNVDSLASFYQAAQDAAYPYPGRYLYGYNEYLIKQLQLYSRTAGGFSEAYRFERIDRMQFTKEISYPGWKKKKTQQELMENYGFLAVIKPEDWCEKYIDPFVEAYQAGRIRQMPVIIYSMWEGYLEKDPKSRVAKKDWIDFLDRQEAKGIRVKRMHTSGHATPRMLAAVINAVDPQEAIYPMHTECAEAFATLPIHEELKQRII